MNLLAQHFFFMALLAGGFASIASGIIGSYVVVKRIAFIAGSISHSVLGGMGLFLYLRRSYDLPWLYPIHGALLAALLSSILIGFIRLKFRQREDTAIASLWVFGMAIGVIFVSLTPGYNVELMHFLFGNILWASTTDIITLIALDAIIVAATALFHKKFVLVCFDEKQAQLQNIAITPLYLLLLCLIGMTVVLLIQVVGAILVIAFLTLPAAMANSWTKGLPSMMLLAVVLGGLTTFFGLTLSFAVNWPPGATIALTATVLYAGNIVIKNIFHRPKSRRFIKFD